jgi:hypothetical protein
LFGGDYSTWPSIAARANDKVNAAARIHSSIAGRINLQSTLPPLLARFQVAFEILERSSPLPKRLKLCASETGIPAGLTQTPAVSGAGRLIRFDKDLAARNSDFAI